MALSEQPLALSDELGKLATRANQAEERWANSRLARIRRRSALQRRGTGPGAILSTRFPRHAHRLRPKPSS